MSDLGSTRIFSSTGRRVVSVGLRPHPLKDLYHHLLTASWTRLFLLFALAYLAVAAAFAAGYLFLSDGIENARPGSAVDAFVFSLQTLSNAKYKPMQAQTVQVELLAGLEGFFRWLGLALSTGLIFTKFSHPRPRVLFSRVAVVARQEGAPALMFRMANERSSHIVDAKLEVMLVRNEAAAEGGEVVRRAHDLPLWRGASALFTHTWTGIHLLDAESPLSRESAQSLANAEGELIVSLSGFDETLSRTIHARHVYRADQILWNLRFRDIVKSLPNGVHRIDYRGFHDVVPLEDRRAETPPRRARG